MTERVKRKPEWLRVKLPGQGEYRDVDKILKDLDLHTVCRSAHCPNIADCWGQRTATIMILGDVCTRFCRFCAVTPGNPGGYVDETEPGRVAEAVNRRSSYTLSLDVLKTLKELERGTMTKSGIMVGLGETDDEVYQALQDMRGVGVEIVTIGQYLQPTKRHLEVQRFVTPKRFAEYERKAKEMGFLAAACAPLVRSSYHAADVAVLIRNRRSSRRGRSLDRPGYGD